MYKDKIKSLNAIAKICRELPKATTTGIVLGSFDIVHLAHLNFLAFAKKKVAKLIVCVMPDNYITLTKGENRPINSLKNRCWFLAHLQSIDFVLPMSSSSKAYHDQIAKVLKPKFEFVHLYSDPSLQIKKKRAKEFGIKLISYKAKKSASTSELIKILAVHQ